MTSATATTGSLEDREFQPVADPDPLPSAQPAVKPANSQGQRQERAADEGPFNTRPREMKENVFYEEWTEDNPASPAGAVPLTLLFAAS